MILKFNTFSNFENQIFWYLIFETYTNIIIFVTYKFKIIINKACQRQKRLQGNYFLNIISNNLSKGDKAEKSAY